MSWKPGDVSASRRRIGRLRFAHERLADAREEPEVLGPRVLRAEVLAEVVEAEREEIADLPALEVDHAEAAPAATRTARPCVAGMSMRPVVTLIPSLAAERATLAPRRARRLLPSELVRAGSGSSAASARASSSGSSMSGRRTLSTSPPGQVTSAY